MKDLNKRQPKPIVVEAFRFVQLQAPKLYTGKNSSMTLVNHPNLLQSKVLNNSKLFSGNNLKQKPNELSLKQAEKTLKIKDLGKQGYDEQEEFTPYSSLRELQQVNEKLYEFLFWLRDNRAKLTKDSLIQHTQGIERLSEEQQLKVWDNLFYQTGVNSSPTLIEGLIRMLQADHFLKHYQEAIRMQEEQPVFPIGLLEQAAKANVVIPKQLFDSDSTETDQEQNRAMDDRSKKILSNQLDRAILGHQIKQYQKTVQTIEKITARHEQQYQVDYEAAYKAYQVQLEALEQSVQEVTNEVGSIRICGEEIAPFEFQSLEVAAQVYLEANLEGQDQVIYQHFRESDQTSSEDIKASIKAAITDLVKHKHNLVKQAAAKTLVHQGIVLATRNRPLNNGYVFKTVPLVGKPNLYTIYVAQYAEQEATKVQQIQAQVQTAEGSQTESIAIRALESSPNYVVMQLFEEGIPLSDARQTFELNGSFETLDTQYNSSFSYQAVRPNTTTAAKSTPLSPSQSIPTPNMYGVVDIKIAAFKKINQTLCCYTEGEVSHIENILAREYKERETRSLTKSESIAEETSERETEKQTDTSSTDRHELQSEIANMLQENQSKSLSASASAGGSFKLGGGSLSFNASGSLNTTSSSGASSNFSEAESYAKEVTEKATQRIVEKTTYKRTTKMLQEFEEKNKHGFDNRKGDKHVTGVYRWVDKIYKNELVNYGKRLMYEFMLPEPARNYKHLLVQNLEQAKNSSVDTMVIEKPISPEDMGILQALDIDETNYAALAAIFGVEMDEGYPEAIKKIAKSFAENFYNSGSKQEGSSMFHAAKSFDFELPEGYECTRFWCDFVAKRYGDHENIFGDLIINDVSTHFNNEYVTTINSTPNVTFTTRTELVLTYPGSYGIPQIPIVTINRSLSSSAGCKRVEGHLPISLAGEDIGPFALNITATCELKASVLVAWKAQFFKLMHANYQRKLVQYQDALMQQSEQNSQTNALNSTIGQPDYSMPSQQSRIVEVRELKRLLIELMMQKVYQNLYAVGSGGTIPIGYNNYLADSCNNTLNIDRNSTFYRNQMQHARFLEQAFEWDIMAYTFLPYYWNDEKEWGDLLQITAAADSIFLAFLQAGMADVVLPVRPGLEKSVAFFLETGKLWKGDGFILDGQDDLYPAIDENMQLELDAQGNEVVYDAAGNPIPKVEATWETRLPSTLTIVQDYSNPLEQEGLPCYCDDDPTNSIGYANDGEYNMLEGKEEE